tara:strand:- start:3133 stop:3390 length:258 start_codon:yes stop_codon:yes gene_type:complete
MSTKLVTLGKNGPLVPQLGFGTMGLTYAVYGQVASDEERFAVLDRAHELGARNWDSSEYVLKLILTKSNTFAQHFSHGFQSIWRW